MVKARIAKLVIWSVLCVLLGSVLQQVSTKTKAAPPVIANANQHEFSAILLTDVETVYFCDSEGRRISNSSFTLPREDTITLHIRRHK